MKTSVIIEIRVWESESVKLPFTAIINAVVERYIAEDIELLEYFLTSPRGSFGTNGDGVCSVNRIQNPSIFEEQVMYANGMDECYNWVIDEVLL